MPLRCTDHSVGDASACNPPALLKFKHDRNRVEVYKDAVSSFLSGMNFNQCSRRCNLSGTDQLSANTFFQLVGKRMRRFIRVLWLVSQRLSLTVSGNMYVEAGWTPPDPMPIIVQYDTRWQKCRGWNSLHSTGYATDYLSGLPVHLKCLHRRRPGKQHDDDEIKPWNMWVQRATHIAEQCLKNLSIEDWVVQQQRRKFRRCHRIAT